MSSSFISEGLRERIRQQAENRCGYCQSAQKYVMGLLEIEHIIPTAEGGTDDESNLWLACRLCNSYKGAQTHVVDPITRESVGLFNPRLQQWAEHFSWSEDGTEIIGLSSCGRATAVALKLNNEIAVTVRTQWVKAGWHPPQDKP